MKKAKNKILEASKIKTKKEEEKFSFQFSGVQLNAVLLFILSATFLLSGASKLTEILGISNTNVWLFLTVLSILILTLSVFSTILGNAIAVSKTKSLYNVLSLILFLLGAIVFFVSLIVLLFSF
tara:strand:+ start:552 stop:923 length:372 start_codon:yes stop_codon:yes gene_type:complete